jgi:hypothetical protein
MSMTKHAGCLPLNIEWFKRRVAKRKPSEWERGVKEGRDAQLVQATKRELNRRAAETMDLYVAKLARRDQRPQRHS